MKSDIKIKIKEDNGKALKIFVLIMALSLLFGMICGIIIIFFNSHITNTLSMLTNNLIYIAPYVSITIVAIASIITFRMYRNAKRLYTSWQEEDENTMYQIDLKLSYVFSITSIVMIIVYFFFGVSFLALGDINQDRTWSYYSVISQKQ